MAYQTTLCLLIGAPYILQASLYVVIFLPQEAHKIHFVYCGLSVVIFEAVAIWVSA